MKSYKTDEKAQEKLILGVKKTADVVKCTLGPKGKNVVLDRKFSTPLITNDGVTIAREFELEEPYENVGCKLIKEVCQKTNLLAGDGTTTAIVLAQKIVEEGLKFCNNGASPILLNKGITYAKNQVIQHIKNIAKQIDTDEEIMHVASVSSGSSEIGKLIAKGQSLIKGGNILLQDSKTANTELVYLEGMSIKSGLISPYFATDAGKSVAEYDESLLLITDKKLNNFALLVPMFEKVMSVKKPLLIICDDIDDEVLSTIIINKMRGTFECCVIKAPMYGDKRLALLEDISAVTDANIISDSKNMDIKEVGLSDLGVLKSVKVSKDSTIIIAKNPDKDKIEARKEVIQNQINNCSVDYDKEQLKKRLSILSGGIATIYVGGNSDIEQKEKKLRIEDAISATTSALDGGIVAGGGVTLFRIAQKIKAQKNMTIDEKNGFEVLRRAIQSPIKQILENAGKEPSVVMQKISQNKNINYGFDALDDKYCDMMEKGIIDPAKVTISALESAVSVATTMLTTSAIVIEKE